MIRSATEPGEAMNDVNVPVQDAGLGRLPAELANYPAVVTLPVQWGDQDAFGHVNNAVPLRWFETSRIAYLEQGGLGHLMSGSGLGPVVVSITCNYRRQLVYPDTVRIGTRIAQLGRTRMTLAHLVYSQTHHSVAADGQTVAVFFDFAAGRPVRLPDEFRDKLQPPTSSRT
jgi:acyl-CoA thioester hydrolase